MFSVAADTQAIQSHNQLGLRNLHRKSRLRDKPCEVVEQHRRHSAQHRTCASLATSVTLDFLHAQQGTHLLSFNQRLNIDDGYSLKPPLGVAAVVLLPSAFYESPVEARAAASKHGASRLFRAYKRHSPGKSLLNSAAWCLRKTVMVMPVLMRTMMNCD